MRLHEIIKTRGWLSNDEAGAKLRCAPQFAERKRAAGESTCALNQFAVFF